MGSLKSYSERVEGNMGRVLDGDVMSTGISHVIFSSFCPNSDRNFCSNFDTIDLTPLLTKEMMCNRAVAR